MAAPLARDQEALVDELLEGEHHRAARNAELLGQDAAGRQRHRGRDLAVEDGRDDRLADLRLQGLAGFRRNAEQAGPDGGVVALWHGSFLADALGLVRLWTSEFVFLVQTVAPMNFSDRCDLCQ